MVRLSPTLVLLAITISCGLAFVPNSNMKCECTCSPINSPEKKYLAVGNFEASIKPKSESVADTEKVPSVPIVLQDSPFKVTDSSKRLVKSHVNKTTKGKESYTNSKNATKPRVQSYSSKPKKVNTISSTSATVQPNSSIELKVGSSAFRKAKRTAVKDSKEPVGNKLTKEQAGRKGINERTKSQVITLDDIIFGRVPYNFGSNGIQRNFLADIEMKETTAPKTSAVNTSKTTIQSTTVVETPSDTTASATTGLETTISKTTPQKTTTVKKAPPKTSISSRTTTQTTTTATEAPTTTPTTHRAFNPISKRGLLPLFRTAYSPHSLTVKKTKPLTDTTVPPFKSTTQSTTINPTTVTKRTTTTPVPTTTTTKPTTPKPTTPKPTTPKPTTPKPTTPKPTTPKPTTPKPTTPKPTTPKPTTRAPTTTTTTTTTTTPKPTTTTTKRPTTKRQFTARKQFYKVQASSPTMESSVQRRGMSLISPNRANPTYSFSESFRRNTIKDLLDAFKPEYMEKKSIKRTVTPNPQPRHVEIQTYRPPTKSSYRPPTKSSYRPPTKSSSVSKMQLPGQSRFGQMEQPPAQNMPSYHLARSMGSLSSMNRQHTMNSPHQSFAVVDSSSRIQQAPYQAQFQNQQQHTSWNPVQEAKKWGEPKTWSQNQHRTANSKNQLSWNSQQQQQQNAVQKSNPAFIPPGFAIAGETPHNPQHTQQLSPFPGLNLPPRHKSPIDFRVH